MTTTALLRTALVPLYRQARSAHPALLLQRGYAEHDADDQSAKTEHLRRICAAGAGDYYTRAYQRWRRATADPLRFTAVELALENRLYIGIAGGGMLETGCAISHSYGLPYLPGSSIKGAVRAAVGRSPFARGHPRTCAELFGHEADAAHPDGLAGVVGFHDAWWVPGSAPTALVREVVTSHHQDYYGDQGGSDASDLDSPVPNGQIAVRGSFLLVLEGAPAWTGLAAQMTLATLTSAGIGAKTRSGYGLFRPPDPMQDLPRCDWVDDKLRELMAKNHAGEDDTLRGKALANAWNEIPDPQTKAEALRAIEAHWKAAGWWDAPPGAAARKAKGIYSSG